MFAKLAEVERREREIDRLLADPAVLADRQRYRELMIERGTVGPIVEKYLEYQKLRLRQDESRALLEEGDAVYFDASLKHRLLACEGVAVQVLAVVTR